jgi:hypothetical protein
MFRITLRLALTAVSAAGMLPAGAGAQALELGAWGGYARSNESTTGFSLCNSNGCEPSGRQHGFERTAPAAGMMLRRESTAWLAFRAEIALAGKGWGPGDEHHRNRVHSTYLELPLLAEVRVVKIGPTRLQLSGGLAPAVLLSCRASVNLLRTRGCRERDPITDEFRPPRPSYDLGWVIAPGIRLPVSRGSLFLEYRHTRGLLDLEPDEQGHTVNESSAVILASTWRLR